MIFDGATYDPTLDHVRSEGQLGRVLALMRDGQWRTLYEIYKAVGDNKADISARLRDLFKPKFGARRMEARKRSKRPWEYRLLLCQIDKLRLAQRIDRRKS